MTKAEHNLTPTETATTKPPAISAGGIVEFDAADCLTLPEMMLDAVGKAADKRITYRLENGSDRVDAYTDLLQEARRLLTGLQQQGLQPKDNLILLLEKNHDIIPVFWACMLGGFRPLIMEVPEQFAAGNRAFEHVCALGKLLEARLIITSDSLYADATRLLEHLPEQTAAIGNVNSLRDHNPTLTHHVSQPDDIACFWLTSGSTGTPKCVTMKHRNILTRAEGANRFNGHNASDVYLNWLPFDHNGSLAEHIRCIKTVCNMVYLHKEDILGDPLNMLRTIDQYGITHTWGPNFIYSLMRDALKASDAEYGWDLSSIKFMISGGEPVSARTMHDFLERAGRYGYPRTGSRPSFGMAEAGGGGTTYGEPTDAEPIRFFWVENHAFNGEDVRQTTPEAPGATPIASLGRPIPGVTIRIIDQQGRVAPEDVVGHVHLKGPLMLEGYYNNPEANAECFLADGWVDTGDLGFLSGGALALTGRAKAMIIIHGRNFYSHEIEAVAEETEGVEHSFTAACAVGDVDNDTDKLAIFFHPLTDDKTQWQQMIRQIRQAIVSRIHVNPEYIIPVEREDIPKTPIGKIQRNLLARRFNQGAFAERLQAIAHLLEQDEAAPRNPLETQLADAWEAILNIRPGIHDNFFDLGGNSIKAVMVMNRFQEKIGAIFHPVSLFDAPTIAGLARYFEDNYPALFKAAEDAATEQVAEPLSATQIEHMRHYLADCLSNPNVHPDLQGGKNPRAVFILSPARSGSTLLRVILAGNPQLFSPPELYLLGFNTLREWRKFYSGRLAYVSEGLTRAIMELRSCTLEQAEQILVDMEAEDISIKQLFAQLQAWSGHRVLVDKSPPYAFNPDILKRLETEFDDPLYVHLMRHPAGMIASFEEARVDLAVDVHGDEDGAVELSGRQKGEAWWLISHQNICEFLKDIPAERQHLIKFEDMVTAPESTLRDLTDFLGVDFHTDMLEPQKDGKRRMVDGAHELSRRAGDPKFHTHQGFSSSSADRWKDVYHQDFLCEQTWQIARHYGYRFDRGVSLSDFQVQPDLANRGTPFPLTDIQQAYWAGRIGSFELGGYSVHSYTEIDGADLDMRRLQQAWQKMVDRHEMLRTIILPDGKQQILVDNPKYNIRVTELGSLDEAGVQTELMATRERLSHQVFAFDQWPLYEICVSRMDEHRYRVHLSFDAILFDARSRYILYTEFRQFYQQPTLALPPFELSFRDYVLAEQRIKDSPLYRQSREYWMRQLATLPGAPELPLAINPTTLTEPKFVQKNHFLPKQDWSRLKARAAQEQITPSCLLMTAFSDVLRTWSKQDSFTLNLTAYNRQPLHPEVNNIIGDFTSLILLDIDSPAQQSFTERAHGLQKRLWDNLNHNHFSGIEVLRELGKRSNHQAGAQMPVVFTSVLGDEISDSANSSGQQSTDWLGEVAFNVAQTPQIWFDHIAFEEGGGLLCRWNVVDTLFPAGMMDAMFDAYLGCLQKLLSEESAWRERWPDTAKRLLTPAQLEQRHAANATDAPIADELMHTLFHKQVAQRPHAPAVIAAERTLSYQELYELSNRIGHRLQTLGVQPNQLVAVVMEKGWQQVAALMGILTSGAAYLPVDPSLPEERFHYLLEFGQVDVVLTESSLHSLMNWPQDTRIVCVDDGSLTNESATLPEIRQQPTDLAYIIFTSGSTGLPKGVMIDHRGAVNTILDINARFNVTPADRAIGLSALNFDLSVYDIFGLLAAGGAVVMPQAADVRNPPQWVKLINGHQVTIWNTVPAFVGLLADYVESHPDADMDSLRLVMMSGDWIPVTLPERIQRHCNQPQVISLGGATEASIWSILYPITQVKPAWSSIPYGKPMLNQQFHVLNSALEDCPVWVPGKLYIGGVGLAKGYWRDTEKTDKAFITHPGTGERLYCTGDLGRYLPDGNIEFLGREDFQVKIQGFRVEIGEIEAALMQHPAIKTAVVDARGEVHAEKQLVAYCIAESTENLQADELRSFLRRKIPAYMVPTVYIPLRDLPLSTNGKVDRKALPDPAKVSTLESAPTVNGKSAQATATSSGIASQILDIVESVLERSGIAPNDNIFNFGATSIHMMRIVNQLEMGLGFRPQIDAFYTDPTVQGLISVYQEIHGGSEADSQPAMQVHALPSHSLLEQFHFITDPAERAAFKQAQHGIRQLDAPSIPLPGSTALDDLYARLRSYRHYSAEPIALANFSDLLSCLRQQTLRQQPKYLYGSAGGLYPLQTYVYIKPNRVESLIGGLYYYHPREHRLILLSEDELDECIYNPHINRPTYQRAAFAIFLISQLAAIAPMYQELALHFSTLEAGNISQLLRHHAPNANLGVCEIGELDFNRVRHLFTLDDSQVLVHSLVGGIPDEDAGANDTAFYQGVFASQPKVDEEEREDEEF
ncbi:non-ribosomal peptide synthetase [Thiothrix nivea]|uniref:Amino acid adenylation domain protein n=1 Tax=Thiothrix nivea (strain ATCC 35100 / DSM 5205 / JP2) TaxID=870187 RepID=A0A656HIW0_THINJ|nr:non-ribosomal peptide synthetase [Thiothrix nivea]EIJ36858.1 amino acid adenylation domain protein [Thiothrix nivea DSM 5205]